MKDSLLLVFANKQDLPDGEHAHPPSLFPVPFPHNPATNTEIPALKPNEVTEALQLSKLKDKVWYVVPSCATTGEGLVEGLGWLSANVKAPLPAPKK